MRLVSILTVVAVRDARFRIGRAVVHVEDANVTFQVDGGLTRGMGNPLFNFRGELEILDKTVAEDLRKAKLGISNLTQHWLDADELQAGALLASARARCRSARSNCSSRRKSIDEGDL